MTAAQRGWGNPDAPNYARDHIVTIHIWDGHVGHAAVALRVRREVSHLFEGFLRELVNGGYAIDVNADDWGYYNRDVRGRPGVKSNHAWGLAVDINAIDNPFRTDGVLVTDMPPDVAQMAARWGLSWGGSWTGGRKDPMHFEFSGRPGDVARYPLDSPVPWQGGEDVPAPLDITAELECPKGGYWQTSAEGGLYAYEGAPYLGGVNLPGDKAELAAGEFIVALRPYRWGDSVVSPDGKVGAIQVSNKGHRFQWVEK